MSGRDFSGVSEKKAELRRMGKGDGEGMEAEAFVNMILCCALLLLLLQL